MGTETEKTGIAGEIRVLKNTWSAVRAIIDELPTQTALIVARERLHDIVLWAESGAKTTREGTSLASFDSIAREAKSVLRDLRARKEDAVEDPQSGLGGLGNEAEAT